MDNRELEKKIKNSFSDITPDTLDSVLRDCRDERKHDENMIVFYQSSKRKRFRKYVSIAAVCTLMIAGVLFYNGYMNTALASIVSLDVNPSMEIKINRNEKVLDVIPENSEAEEIIGDMDFRGNDLDITVNALVGSMFRNGYLSEISNSILVSVESKNDDEGSHIREIVINNINSMLSSDGMDAAVLGQTVTTDRETGKIADKYGISKGKAQLIKKVRENDKRYTYDQLASLSINELSLIIETGSGMPPDIKVQGKSSEKAYIGVDNAKKAAFKAAGINAGKAENVRYEYEHEDGIMVYEISFICNGTEYEYDVNAVTGAILKMEKEKAGTANNNVKLTEDMALDIALKHAGLTSKDVKVTECKTDIEKGIYIYEIEFKAGNTEYEYEVDAETGRIIKSEKES